MAKLESETRKIINKYYDDKIKQFRDFIELRRNELKEEYKEKFKNDEKVKEIRNLFNQLEKEYKDVKLNLLLSRS